jgi:hypothetical protein
MASFFEILFGRSQTFFHRPDERLGKNRRYHLELKDRNDTSDAKMLEFDGQLFYKSTFHYVSIFDAYTEIIEFFRTSTSNYVLHWPSTGQMLIRPTAKAVVDTISTFGLTPEHRKELCQADDAIKEVFRQETRFI